MPQYIMPEWYEVLTRPLSQLKMEIPATPLHLPPTLPYPITITRISSPADTSVSRGSKLLEYSFRQSSPAEPSTSDHKSLMLFGSWDCSLEGTVESWNVKVGQTLALADARSISLSTGVVLIRENCRHDVQIGGMCAVCGEDMTRRVRYSTECTCVSDYLQDGLHRFLSGFLGYTPIDSSGRWPNCVTS